MQFSAPYPAVQTNLITVNPDFSDTEGLTASVSSKRAVDGTLYTYIKRKGGRRKMTWTLVMARPAALALRAFLFSYFASKIRVEDHNGRIWIGNFMNNPFEFDTPSGGGPVGVDGLRNDLQSVTLEFEGIEQ